MESQQAPKTRNTLIQRIRKRISGIRGVRQGRGHERPFSPASVLEFPAEENNFPSPLSSSTISNVPPFNVPYNLESVVASSEPSFFVHEVIEEDVDTVPPALRTPNDTIHIENNASLKTLPTNRKKSAHISSANKRNCESKETKQSFHTSPVAQPSAGVASVPMNHASPTVNSNRPVVHSPPSSSVGKENLPAFQALLNTDIDISKAIPPTAHRGKMPPPSVASVEAAAAQETSTSAPAVATPKENGSLIGRKVRILKHPKDKRYKAKIGRITKQVRKATYTVEFDDTNLGPIDKTFKTMELLDEVQLEQVPAPIMSYFGTEKEHSLEQETTATSSGKRQHADDIPSDFLQVAQLGEERKHNSMIVVTTGGGVPKIQSREAPTSHSVSGQENKTIQDSTSSTSSSDNAKSSANPSERHSTTNNAVERNSPATVSTNSSNTASVLRIGRKVKILRHPQNKKYVGKIGHICEQVTTKRFRIAFSDLDPITKQQETLKILEDDGQPVIQQSVDTLSSSAVARTTSKDAASMASDATQKRRSTARRSLLMSRGRKEKSDNLFQSGDHWRVPDSERGGIRIGRRRIVKIRTARVEDNNRGKTLLSHLLGNRVLEHDNPISEFELEEPFSCSLEQGGYKYELVATKVHADGDNGSCTYCKPKVLRLTYAEVQGPSLEEFSTADYLERLANFSALDPRKAKARLELLQSPAHMLGKNQPAIFHLTDDSFSTVQDNGVSQGCGFISEEMLEAMFGSNAKAKRILQVQVRIIVPKVGISKGTLMRAPRVAGIQLFPASMTKVSASVHPNAFDGGVVLVCQGGVHPSPINEYIGRRLDPNAKPPPEKSFRLVIKPLSDMIMRLWSGMGVPPSLCSEYAKKSRSPQHINHAWVCGAADFSSCLPPGHVFVTGLTKGGIDLDHIFVTRSPCMEPTDGRMLPLVKLRPEGMSIEDWEWLGTLAFGSIVFANPLKGMKTLPEHIADGDLDGDRYFICWDPTILGCIKAIPIVDVPVSSSSKSRLGATNENSDWFEKAQDWMLASATTELKIQQLTGALFSLSNKTADESPLQNKDLDAIALAAAYKQALDVGKHGGPIFLPAHLHEKLPEALRPYVTGTKND